MPLLIRPCPILTSGFCVTRLILGLTIFLSSAATATPHFPEDDPGDAALSSEIPHIPEPMVFDLVRPLGVRQGDAEVNTLVSHSFRKGHTEWAPEFEFGFLDNYAIEFELPFDNLSLSEYKLGLQGTIGTLFGNHFIHGWQVLFQHDRHKKEYSADFLYLAGYRWNTGISTFNMAGVRRDNFERDGKFVGVFNTSWFYDYSEQLTVGIELNNEFEERGRWNYMLTPQIHWDFTQNTTLQLGIGVSQKNGKDTDWSGTWRLVYAF